MNKNLIATQSIKINTKAEKVWRILTDPEKIKIYLFGTETTTVWNVGSPILFQGDYNGQAIKTKELLSKTLKIAFYPIITGVGFRGLKTNPKTIQ